MNQPVTRRTLEEIRRSQVPRDVNDLSINELKDEKELTEKSLSKMRDKLKKGTLECPQRIERVIARLDMLERAIQRRLIEQQQRNSTEL